MKIQEESQSGSAFVALPVPFSLDSQYRLQSDFQLPFQQDVFRMPVFSEVVPAKSIKRSDVQSDINYCQLTFRDNGIGFDPAFSDQIFELFQRLHGRAEYSGSGIGLSICKKIAENHKGFIVAEGKPNEGATFTIYFPIKH